jgi:beta-1,4-N-acetylglucosaminyltransferase
MRAFVTVGSTRFDPLVYTVLSTTVLDVLRERGYTALVVQCGHSDIRPVLPDGSAAGPWSAQLSGLVVDIFRFKPSLEDDFRNADLVISHAGAPSLQRLLRCLTHAYQAQAPFSMCCVWTMMGSRSP